MPPTAIYFSQDVSDYMELNGFKRLQNNSSQEGMIWQKEKIAVQFWQSRIEMQEQNVFQQYKVTNAYRGFDGHNIQHLIMILHCMGAITIESAVKLADAKDGNMQPIGKILLSLPLTDQLCHR